MLTLLQPAAENSFKRQRYGTSLGVSTQLDDSGSKRDTKQPTTCSVLMACSEVEMLYWNLEMRWYGWAAFSLGRRVMLEGTDGAGISDF